MLREKCIGKHVEITILIILLVVDKFDEYMVF